MCLSDSGSSAQSTSGISATGMCCSYIQLSLYKNFTRRRKCPNNGMTLFERGKSKLVMSISRKDAEDRGEQSPLPRRLTFVNFLLA